VDAIPFPHGSLTPEQLVAVLGALPLDMTFVDEKGIVRYFSAYRIFSRPQSCLGRDVLDCHSPATRSNVAGMLAEFESGQRDTAEFLAHEDARAVEVRYVALRDGDGRYTGCLEMCRWVDSE
jgi:DUF438 domain-containing protein